MPKNDDVKPPWWYTSANPQTVLQASIAAPSSPGTEAASLVGAPEEEDDLFSLDPMTPQLYEQVFGKTKDGEPAPVYGADSRGPAMHQEDITAVGGKRGDAVRLARSFVGTPYVWGGSTPDGFDCSGFVQYVYKKAFGIDLPRVSYQ